MGLSQPARLFASVTDIDAYSHTELAVTRLGANTIMVSGAGGNIVGSGAAGGVVMVDGGLASRSRELLELVLGKLSAARVDVLFNTHWHPERIGLNETLGRAGARIVAHENTKLWLGTEISRPWDNSPVEPLPVEALPNETFYTRGELALGGRAIRFGYMLQSHTDGDIYVHLPQENVLVAGGVISSDGWPLIDWWTGGWMLGLVDGLDDLIEVADDETKVVPGSGPVMNRADLLAQRDMYLVIYERLMDLFFAAKSPEEAVAAAPTKGFNEQWGDPAPFVTLAFQSLWGQLAPNV